MKYILLGIFCMGMIGCVSKENTTRNYVPEKGVYLYVFNDTTQLWNRAREESLKNAACNKLHAYELIGKEKNDITETTRNK